MPQTCLVVGGTRGLGQSLVKELLARGNVVYATARSTDLDKATNQVSEGIQAGKDKLVVLPGIDLADPSCADVLDKGLKAHPGTKFDLVINSAGYFKPDTLDKLAWEEHAKMFAVCSIAPAFVASTLVANDAMAKGGKFLLVTTEGGSLALRTPQEGGGNYGHHASKAASNMIARLLAIDLIKKGVTTVAIHPGFMRTDGTGPQGMGFAEAWDEGGAVSPDEGARSLLDFAEQVDETKNGQFWAPRGPRDVGQAENVMGKNLPTPLELPW